MAGKLVEQERLFVVGGRFGSTPQVEVGSLRGQASTWGADNELLPEEIRLDFVAQGIGREVHGGGKSLNAGRAALKDTDQGLQVAAILLVHALAIDLSHGKGRAGNLEGDAPVGLAG